MAPFDRYEDPWSTSRPWGHNDPRNANFYHGRRPAYDHFRHSYNARVPRNRSSVCCDSWYPNHFFEYQQDTAGNSNNRWHAWHPESYGRMGYPYPNHRMDQRLYGNAHPRRWEGLTRPCEPDDAPTNHAYHDKTFLAHVLSMDHEYSSNDTPYPRNAPHAVPEDSSIQEPLRTKLQQFSNHFMPIHPDRNLNVPVPHSIKEFPLHSAEHQRTGNLFGGPPTASFNRKFDSDKATKLSSIFNHNSSFPYDQTARMRPVRSSSSLQSLNHRCETIPDDASETFDAEASEAACDHRRIYGDDTLQETELDLPDDETPLESLFHFHGTREQSEGFEGEVLHEQMDYQGKVGDKLKGKINDEGTARAETYMDAIDEHHSDLKRAWSEVQTEWALLHQEQAIVRREQSALRAGWRSLHRARAWNYNNFPTCSTGTRRRNAAVYESDTDQFSSAAGTPHQSSSEDDGHFYVRPHSASKSSAFRSDQATREQSNGYLAAYNAAWTSITSQSPASGTIPWPTPSLRSDQLMSPPPYIRFEPTNDSIHTLTAYNTIDFLISAFGIDVKLYRSGPRNGDLMYKITGGANADLEKVKEQLKLDKVRWHEDRLRLSGFGQILDGQDAEMVKGVWEGIQRLRTWLNEETNKRQTWSGNGKWC